MQPPGFPTFKGRQAVLATMHAKERVIAPALRDGIGLVVEPLAGFDTDRFGTFSREIGRTGSQLDAARAKIAAAFEARPQAQIAIASEGSFGPDPVIPFLPLAQEIVVLSDRMTGLELIGYDGSHDSNFAHSVAADVEAGLAFAARIGFPEHGIIVMATENKNPAPKIALMKEVRTVETLASAVRDIVARCGTAHLETDMRAHRNPTRMRAIERAAQDLVRRFYLRCPDCGFPGYDIVERISGLPCEWCGLPTDCAQFVKLSCKRCGREEQRPAAAQSTADPGHCSSCNP